jgi:hypothetical protein
VLLNNMFVVQLRGKKCLMRNTSVWMDPYPAQMIDAEKSTNTDRENPGANPSGAGDGWAKFSRDG